MSQRDRYSYQLNDKVRLRILHTLNQHKGVYMVSEGFNFDGMINEVGDKILAKHGEFRRPAYKGVRHSENVVIEHFLRCPDNEAIEFLQFCFETDAMCRTDVNRAVGAINKIFEEERIGYELTEQQRIETTNDPATFLGRLLPGGKSFRPVHPRIIRKDQHDTHLIAVKPALAALGGPRFATANSELLKAFEHVQDGDYPEAITSCGAAFESVMKTICDAKGWQFDPCKDTCSKLAEVCRGNLFFPFYTEVMKNVGTIRNNLGSVHGRGASPPHKADREHAEHMIAMTCAHITFLIKLAKL